MNNNKLVSILIISYDNIQYLKGCIDSILSQDYSHIEIIISDDCSKEFDKEDIKNYIETNKKDNIVNYVINENEVSYGTVKNFNNAINLSTGDIIVNLSCDDELFNNTVISTIKDFHDNDERLVAIGSLAYFEKNLTEWNGYYTPLKENIKYIEGDPIECFKKICELGLFFPSQGLSYKRKLIEDYGLYDEEYKMFDDLPRLLSLTRRGCKLGFINSNLVKFRADSTPLVKEKTAELKEIFDKDSKLVEEKDILPYYKLINDDGNVKAENISNVLMHTNNIFNQDTHIEGKGQVIIGKGSTFGNDLDPHFNGFNILLKSEYPSSVIIIGDNVTFSNDISIIAHNKVSIGDNCKIGYKVIITDFKNNEKNSLVIGNNVSIGSGAIILNGVTIGDNCIIEPRAMVVNDIKSNSRVIGNPAKIIEKA